MKSRPSDGFGALNDREEFPRPLKRSDLPVAAAQLARWLIGKTLVREHAAGRMCGRIVETEAYVVGDASSHAFKGRTARNASMFLERGHAYVYFIYGSWFSLNVSADRAGVGAGVLLRAIEPLEGAGLMALRRGDVRLHDLARGPGRLATALDITRALDGHDMCGGPSPLWLGERVARPGPIETTTRIGITREEHRLLRFFEKGNPCVSGLRRLNVRR